MWYEEAQRFRHITPEQLKAIMPRCPDPEKWAEAFDDAIEEAGGVPSAAMLLAQVGHESSDLTRLEESLWYSAKRLTQVWPSRFPTIAAAEPYAGNPEALANKTYGGRMGNTSPGDGWAYHGRGPIQITGRYNYRLFEIASGYPVLKYPDTLLEPKVGAASAVWFFVVNVHGDWADVRNVTKQVNGGYHGLQDRTQRYERAAALIT